MKNVGRDFIEKTTTNLVSKAKHVCLESLNVEGMMQNGKLAALIARQGFYQFRQRLTTKIVGRSGTIVLADQWFPSSKTCHSCGCLNKELKLKDPTFNFPNCGMKIDRDLKCGSGVISVWGS